MNDNLDKIVDNTSKHSILNSAKRAAAFTATAAVLAAAYLGIGTNNAAAQERDAVKAKKARITQSYDKARPDEYSIVAFSKTGDTLFVEHNIPGKDSSNIEWFGPRFKARFDPGWLDITGAREILGSGENDWVIEYTAVPVKKNNKGKSANGPDAEYQGESSGNERGQREWIKRDTNTVFVAGRIGAELPFVPLQPRHNSYAFLFDSENQVSFKAMTMSKIENILERAIKGYKKSHPKDHVIIADERLLSQIKNSTYPKATNADSTLLRKLSEYMNDDSILDTKEIERLTSMVGENYNQLLVGVMAYTTKKGKEESIPMVLMIPGQEEERLQHPTTFRIRFHKEPSGFYGGIFAGGEVVKQNETTPYSNFNLDRYGVRVQAMAGFNSRHFYIDADGRATFLVGGNFRDNKSGKQVGVLNGNDLEFIANAGVRLGDKFYLALAGKADVFAENRSINFDGAGASNLESNMIEKLYGPGASLGVQSDNLRTEVGARYLTGTRNQTDSSQDGAFEESQADANGFEANWKLVTSPVEVEATYRMMDYKAKKGFSQNILRKLLQLDAKYNISKHWSIKAGYKNIDDTEDQRNWEGKRDYFHIGGQYNF